MRAIIELNNRLAALERRVAGGMRHGTVAEVNTGGGWVRLDLGPDGDGGKLLSPKIPYAQMAGALKVHAPPSVGQQMTVMAPTGDMSQGVAVPMTWSDQNAAPASGSDNALTFGDVRVDLKEAELTVTIGGATLTITPDQIRAALGGSSVTVSEAGVSVAGARIDLN